MLLLLSLIATADFTQFRDPVLGEDVPIAFDLSSGENVAWIAALKGRGLSSPVVIGDRVVLTYCAGLDQERLGVVCFDDATGRELWKREFWATGRTAAHQKTSNAAPSPASDGERVFAFWSSGDLVAIALDGTVQWVRGLQADYPNASNSLGMSSSLAYADGTVVVQLEADAKAVAFGIDAENGTNRWVLDNRPTAANWTSPVVVEAGGRSLALLQSSDGVTAVDAATGSEVWTFDEGASTIPSTAVGSDRVYVPSGGVAAIDPGTGEVVWKNDKLNLGTASAIELDGRLYTLNRQGVLTAADAATGETLSKERVVGPYSASPVAAAGRLYLVNEEGVVKVVDVSGDEPEIVHEAEFGETILATPAIRGDAMYLRSDGHLWKIAPTEASAESADAK